MGETEIPLNIFEEFLRSISSKYTMDKYDLFENNCNNFTNECAKFLIGKGIPENITGNIEIIIYIRITLRILKYIIRINAKTNN